MLIPQHLRPLLCMDERCTRMREHPQAGRCWKPSVCKRGDFWARHREVDGALTSSAPRADAEDLCCQCLGEEDIVKGKGSQDKL